MRVRLFAENKRLNETAGNPMAAMPGGNRIAVLAKASGSTIGPGDKLAKDGY